MESPSPTLDVSARLVDASARSGIGRVHAIIERHRVTLITVLILILATAVAMHMPDHGVVGVHRYHVR
ncbi:MAG TPA: hypothetical protein VIJ09_04570 [Acidimicrobiales bacterium]|jgi:hypothetical protein